MRKPSYQLAVPILISCLLAGPAGAQNRARRATASSAPVLWSDPGQVENLDFFNGPGGPKNIPKTPFTFVEEDKGGTNPKIKVTDAPRRHWGVKWGQETRFEVFASRLVWAVGYYVEPNYIVTSGKVSGVKGLTRAKKYVASDGTFSNARFELKRKGISKRTDKESWSWDKNPFVGTREL